MDEHPLDRWISRQLVTILSLGLAIAVVIVLVWFPEFWFFTLGAMIVLVSGLVTSKVLLQLENPWAAFGLAPLFGSGWLILLWLLFKLVG